MQVRETHLQRRHPATSEFPLLQQPGVHSKMKTFHSKLASLTVSKCITCLERFPGLTVAIVSPDSTECVRCRRDNTSPRSANNMNPGPVPPELMVCEKNIMCEAFIMNASVQECLSVYHSFYSVWDCIYNSMHHLHNREHDKLQKIVVYWNTCSK